MAKLNFMDRENLLREFEITEELITIGREANNKLVVADPSVSRLHAWVEKREGGYYLIDKNSSNGSFVNGKKITEQKLSHNDKVQLGNAQIVFEDEEQVSSTFILPRADMEPPITEPTSTKPDLASLKPDERPTSAVDVGPPSKPTPPPKPPEPPPAPAPHPPAAVPAPPPRPEAPSSCPSCKKPLEPGARFCGSCGASISPKPPSPPPPPPPSPPSQSRPPAPPPPPLSRPQPPVPPPPPAPSGGSVHPLTHGFQPQPPAQGKIAGHMQYAGFGPRLLAYLIDGVILNLIMAAPVGLLIYIALKNGPGSTAYNVSIMVASLLSLVIALGYQLIFVGLKGATPGKKVLKLKITLADGTYPIGIGKAFIRLIGYAASAFICYFGFIMIALDKEQHRGLHDKIAGTVVIREA